MTRTDFDHIIRKAAVVFIIIAICSSCTKKESQNGASGNAAKETEITAGTAGKNETAPQETDGVIYVHKAALYVENEEGKMKWTKEASLGDRAFFLGEKKEAARTDGQKRTFFHISLKDHDYWIQDYCYEPNTVPAFISAENTLLYKSDSAMGMTDEVMPQFFIVAVYKDSQDNDKFCKIAAYCPELATSWVVKEAFVKRENLEFDGTAIEAMMLAQVASESKNDTIRAELYRNAIELESAYSDKIAELQNLNEFMIQEDAFIKSINVEKINEKSVVSENVDLLSVPRFDGGYRIVGELKAGTPVVATKQVVFENGDGWCYIQHKQKKGWVRASILTQE